MFVRLQNNQRVRLNLTRPAGQTLLLAILLSLALAAALEILARSSFVQERLPFQAYGTNHIQFEMQIEKLRRYAALHGAPDCLILGTSQALRGINPEVFSQAFAEQTGQEIHCYNFSIVGANLPTTLTFSKILISAYHPSLLILGTSFLDYTAGRELRFDPRFQENDWLEYRQGKFNLAGWLAEHSYAYRLLMLFSYSAPSGLDFSDTNKEIRRWQAELTDYGYAYAEDIANMKDSVAPSEIKNLQEEFGDYTVSAKNMSELDVLLDLAQQENIPVLVAGMPYHSALIELPGVPEDQRPDPERAWNFVREIEAQVQFIAAQHNDLFIHNDDPKWYPKSGWYDRYHLNAIGSAAFSKWLAAQYAAAIASGQTANPFTDR